MAALRRLVAHNPNLSYASLLPPALLICCRGIASKLFVGEFNVLYMQYSACITFGIGDTSLDQWMVSTNEPFESYLSPEALPLHCDLVRRARKPEKRREGGERALISLRISKTSTFNGAGLSFYTTEKGLSEAFSQHGQVVEAKIVTDRVSDRSKGFGFVTFASEDEADKAITEMNGKTLNGRVVFVDYAKAKSNFGGGMPIARGPPEPIVADN